MRPMITLLTSTELQDALGNPLDDDEMDTLQEFRDAVQEEFRQHLDAASVMEDLYGETWRKRDMPIWVIDHPDADTISSPILINEESEEEALFAVLYMLAKNLIREEPPDSDLIEPGTEKLDAVAALLAWESLRDVMKDERVAEVMDTVTGNGDQETWAAMEEYADAWNPETETLYDWLEEQ